MISQLFSPMAWGSPLGIGLFLVCLSLSLFLMSLGVKNLDSVSKKK